MQLLWSLKDRKQLVRSTLSQPQCRRWGGVGPQDFVVHNRDGALTNPQANRESRMVLKPTTLAKGEHVLRIVDFVDKIASMVEHNTRTSPHGSSRTFS